MNEEMKRTERPWTPGPWSVFYHDGITTVDARGERPPVELFEVLFSLNQHGENMEIGQANARLIAAAPELFEALEEMRDAMRRYEMDVDGDAPRGHRQMMRRAETAMNKALGVDGA